MRMRLNERIRLLSIRKALKKLIKDRKKKDPNCPLCEQYEAALQDPDMLEMLAEEVELQSAPPEDIFLGDDDGPLIRFIKYILENPDKIAAFIKMIMGFFA